MADVDDLERSELLKQVQDEQNMITPVAKPPAIVRRVFSPSIRIVDGRIEPRQPREVKAQKQEPLPPAVVMIRIGEAAFGVRFGDRSLSGSAEGDEVMNQNEKIQDLLMSLALLCLGLCVGSIIGSLVVNTEAHHVYSKGSDARALVFASVALLCLVMRTVFSR